jgi:hypothetical protein
LVTKPEAKNLIELCIERLANCSHNFVTKSVLTRLYCAVRGHLLASWPLVIFSPAAVPLVALCKDDILQVFLQSVNILFALCICHLLHNCYVSSMPGVDADSGGAKK